MIGARRPRLANPIAIRLHQLVELFNEHDHRFVKLSNNGTSVWAPDPEDPEVTEAIKAYGAIVKKIIEYCETKDSELQQEEDKAREETESKLVPLNEELKKLEEVFGAAQKHLGNISSRRALNLTLTASRFALACGSTRKK